ncbi:hypothetical protein FBUS_02405 [Fasciolopsis buskii]|uniref:Uncharacterized protein n=1 Tax=Fasciolopsis buskii TaxID=27845 RepID=A0A8E0VRG5_9TREM|nr:hypothetical protein FBUS_02405 [Fasciolopsis buski]
MPNEGTVDFNRDDGVNAEKDEGEVDDDDKDEEEDESDDSLQAGGSHSGRPAHQRCSPDPIKHPGRRITTPLGPPRVTAAPRHWPLHLHLRSRLYLEQLKSSAFLSPDPETHQSDSAEKAVLATTTEYHMYSLYCPLENCVLFGGLDETD